MKKEQLVSLVKELDALMPMPQSPDDENTPVMFGTAGIFVMGDNGSPLLLGCYDDPAVMLADDSLAPFGNGYGHLFFVHYGVLVDTNMNKDDDDAYRTARVIIGITPDGLATSLFRGLVDDEVFFVDENCEQTPHDPFVELFS